MTLDEYKALRAANRKTLSLFGEAQPAAPAVTTPAAPGTAAATVELTEDQHASQRAGRQKQIFDVNFHFGEGNRRRQRRNENEGGERNGEGGGDRRERREGGGGDRERRPRGDGGNRGERGEGGGHRGEGRRGGDRDREREHRGGEGGEGGQEGGQPRERRRFNKVRYFCLIAVACEITWFGSLDRIDNNRMLTLFFAGRQPAARQP